MSTEPARKPALAFAAASLLFAGTVSALMVVAGWCDLHSLREFPIDDYGVYTNWIWNSGHGAPFKFLVDGNYLTTHLSFTLLLLAPLFWAWDHMALLMVVQWALPLIGGTIVFATATRLGIALPLRAALAALFVVYPYAQSPVLYTFHGVCLYFLLVPWVYHCLRFSRRWVWLPWLLMLGVREDAGLLILPMLLYFAIAHRDRLAQLLSLLTVVYSLVAIYVLFPAIVGKSLAKRRKLEMNPNRLKQSLDATGLLRRAVALFWLVLPAIPLLRRRWRPILIFPAAGTAILMLSWWDVRHGLTSHYSAYVFPFFVMGVLEAVAGVEEYRAAAGAASPLRLAGWIMGAVVFAHFTLGRFPSEYFRTARRLDLTCDPAMSSAFEAAKLIPRTGLLIADKRLFSRVANRADIAALEGQKFGRPVKDADSVFLMRTEPGGEELYQRLSADGDFAARFVDERFAVFVRTAARKP